AGDDAFAPAAAQIGVGVVDAGVDDGDALALAAVAIVGERAVEADERPEALVDGLRRAGRLRADVGDRDVVELKGFRLPLRIGQVGGNDAVFENFQARAYPKLGCRRA